MTIQETIVGLVKDYKSGKIKSADQLKKVILFVAVSDKKTFEVLRANYLKGNYDKFLPSELRSTVMSQLGDNELPVLKEVNAIKKDFASGQLTEAT